MAGYRQIINGPEFTPLPNFLWDAVQKPSAAGENAHWQQGVTWIERCGGTGSTYEECIAVTGTGGTPSAPATLTSNVSQANRGATAFTIFSEFDCAPIGQDYSQDKAEEALAKMESFAVTRALWTGTAGGQSTVWPRLAANAVLDDPFGIRLQTAASPLVTGGEDAAIALGQVEASLAACYGGQGVIHIPYLAFPTFKSRGLVCRENPTDPWTTAAGNLVVPGSGYTGSSPAGAAPAAGTSWIYATGPMFGFRSDVFVRDFPSTFDRAENTVRMQASRTYLFGFECCHFGALVVLGVPT